MVAKLGGDRGGLVAWPYAEPWVIEVGLRSTRLEERTWKQFGSYPLRRDLAG
jgi:hypothetical protein